MLEFRYRCRDCLLVSECRVGVISLTLLLTEMFHYLQIYYSAPRATCFHSAVFCCSGEIMPPLLGVSHHHHRRLISR